MTNFTVNIIASIGDGAPRMIVKDYAITYCVQVAHKIFTWSKSAAFKDFVTSIDVFLPDPSKGCRECNKPISQESCSYCQQPTVGPTKYFRDFVEEFSPGEPQSMRQEF